MDENASDALKMAAAILVFLVALSVAIYAFSKARTAASSIMDKLSDSEEYYDTDNIKLGDKDYKITSYRKVGAETIIPTILNCYEKGDVILFYTGSVNENDNIIGNITPLTLYESSAYDTYLQKSTLAKKNGDKNSKSIYGIDLNDEITRQEPWTKDDNSKKTFIQNFINATAYEFSKSNGTYKINFSYTDTLGKSIANISSISGKFIERVGQYNYDALYDTSTSSDDTTIEQYNKTNLTNSAITFNNGETMENNSGNVKRVIQYIYIK